jgi:hypothetical protein
MKNRKQLLFYILVNIIVSAATILLVLWIWDKPNRSQATEPPPVSSYLLDNSPSEPVGTPIPLNQEVIRIKNIFGAGDVQNEMVELVRVGDGDVYLTGWQLKDEDGNTYTFPNGLIMFAGAGFNVYTRISNSESVIEGYWKSSEAIWRPGETATLVDAQGNVRATYTIP